MWKLTDSVALIQQEIGAIGIDAVRPGEGTRLTSRDSLPIAFWQLPQLATCPLAECYTRGNDLVATYMPADSFPFRTQLYWSWLPEANDVLAIQLLVSVQTDLLDTHPIVNVGGPTTRCSRRQLEFADATVGELFTVGEGNHELLLAIHPTDATHGGRLLDNNWCLFEHFLEKGVIRRARLLAALVDSANADVASRGVYETFRDQELPLTV
jgi:hypothetical protein